MNRLIQFLYAEKEYVDPASGYNLWAQAYDNEDNNLMHFIDETTLTELFKKISFKNKIVVDFGCGTGRNWPVYMAKEPSEIIGLDVSEGMLNALKAKIPNANVLKIQPNDSLNIQKKSADIVISTLALEHVKNIELVFKQWSEVLKNNAEIIITGYHPIGLQKGGQVSFKMEKKSYIIEKSIHPIAEIERIALIHGFVKIYFKEVFIDAHLKAYYEKLNAISVYKKFEGTPLYYAIHLKRIHEAH